jgi:hypothetical protein
LGDQTTHRVRRFTIYGDYPRSSASAIGRRLSRIELSTGSLVMIVTSPGFDVRFGRRFAGTLGTSA